MPQPNRLQFAAALAPAGLRSILPPLLLAAVAVTWLLTGITCLWFRWHDPLAGPALAPAGVALVLLAIAQFRLLAAARRAGRLTAGGNPRNRLRAWRLFLTGAVVAYLAALLVGHTRYVGCAWLAAVCGWQTLLLLPLAAAPSSLENWRRWTSGPAARRLAWLIYASIAILVVAELGLRGHRILGNLAASGRGAHAPLAESPALSARVKRARFRLAVLYDQPAGEAAPLGGLTRMERAMPGVELLRLDASLTSLERSDRALAGEVRHHDPDLLLVVLPVCQDLARKPVEWGYFDWRQFELAALVAGPPAIDVPASAPPVRDFESFLGALRPQLAACRTPIDEAMHVRWRRTYASLDRLIRTCDEAGVPVAMAIVPAEFQLNRALCDTLLRRNGLTADRFDVELPQRRLARFAENRRLPLIDLLPHLRLCRESVYRRHATALSDEGNSVAASAIGGWLQSRYGSQLAAQLSAAP